MENFESTGTVQNVLVPVSRIYFSHTSFLSFGHLCAAIMANFTRWFWPTFLQNQIEAKTEAAWPPVGIDIDLKITLD